MKRAADGRWRWLWVLVLAPYLAWYVLGRYVFRTRRVPLFEELRPRLYVGAVLREAQARAFLGGVVGELVVYDFSAELPECAWLASRAAAYKARPLLDLSSYTTCQALADEVWADYAAGSAVFLHCSFGQSRSRFVAKLLLEKYL